jgi:hypothetical protein
MLATGILDGSVNSEAYANLLVSKLSSVQEALQQKRAEGIEPTATAYKPEGDTVDYLNKATGDVLKTILDVPQTLRDNILPNAPLIHGGVLNAVGEGVDWAADKLDGSDNSAVNFLQDSLRNLAGVTKSTAEPMIDAGASIQDLGRSAVDYVDNNPYVKAAVDTVAAPINTLMDIPTNAGNALKDVLTNDEVGYRAGRRLGNTYASNLAKNPDSPVAASLGALADTVADRPSDVLKFMAQAAPSGLAAAYAPGTFLTGMAGQNIKDNLKALDENQANAAFNDENGVLNIPIDVPAKTRAASVVASLAGAGTDFFGDKIVGNALTGKGLKLLASGGVLGKAAAGVADVGLAGTGEYAAESGASLLNDIAKNPDAPLTDEQIRNAHIQGLEGALGAGGISATRNGLDLANSGINAAANKAVEMQADRVNTKALDSGNATERMTAFTKDPELNKLGTEYPDVKYSALAPEDHKDFNPIKELENLHTDWQGFMEDQITNDKPTTLKEKMDSFSQVVQSLNGAVTNLKDLNDAVQASDTATPKQKKELQRLLDFSIKDAQEKSKVAPEIVGKYMDDIVATMQNRAAEASKVTEEDLTPETLQLAQEAALHRVENPTANTSEEDNTKAIKDLRTVSVTKEAVPAVVATDDSIQQVVDTIDKGIAQLEAESKTLGANPNSKGGKPSSYYTNRIKKLQEVSNEIQHGKSSKFPGLQSHYARNAAIYSAKNDVTGLEDLQSQLDNWLGFQTNKQLRIENNSKNHLPVFIDAVRETTQAIENMQTELAVRIKEAKAKQGSTKASVKAPSPVNSATSSTSSTKPAKVATEAPNSTSVDVNVTNVNKPVKATTKATKSSDSLASDTTTTTKSTKPVEPVNVDVTRAETPQAKADSESDTKAVEDKPSEVESVESTDNTKADETEANPTSVFKDVTPTNLTTGDGFGKTAKDREQNINNASKAISTEIVNAKPESDSIIKTMREKAEDGVRRISSNIHSVLANAAKFHRSVSSRIDGLSEDTTSKFRKVLASGIRTVMNSVSEASIKKGGMATYHKVVSESGDRNYINQNTILNLLSVREKNPKTNLIEDTLDPTVAAHVVVAALDYAKFMLKSTTDITLSTVEQVFGAKSLAKVPVEYVRKAEAFLKTVGLPVSTAAMSIGKDIARMSNIEFSEESFVEDKDAMHTALGVAALNYLNILGLVTYSEVPNSAVAELKQILQNPTRAPTPSKSVATNLYFKFNVDNEAVWEELMKQLKDPSGKDILEAFRGESRTDTKALQPAAYGSVKTTRAANRVPPKEVTNAAKTLNETPFKFNPYLVRLLVEPSTRVAAAQQVIQSLSDLGNFKLTGLDDTEITESVRYFVDNNVQAMKRIEQEAVITDHIRSVKRLLDFIDNDIGQDTSKLDNDFFARYAVDVNDRIRLDSTINPGSDKAIHRLFLVDSNSHNVIKAPATNNDYKDALASNLGLIDEKSDTAAVESARKSMRKLMTTLSKNLSEDALNDLQKLLNEDTSISTSVDIGKLYKAINTTEGMVGKVEDLSTLMDLANLTLRFPREGKATKHKFTSTLVVEVDGKSNGVFLALVQSPIGDLATQETLLRKVGIYLNNSFKSFADWASNKNGLVGHHESDIYEHNAEGMSGVLKSVFSNDAPEVAQAKLKAISNLLGEVLVSDDGIISKIARELNKNPLMVFSYNAGESTIDGNVTDEIFSTHIPNRIMYVANLAKQGDRTAFDAFKKSLKQALAKDITDTNGMRNIDSLSPENAINFRLTPKQLNVLKDKLIKPTAESLTIAVSEIMSNQRNVAKLTTKIFQEQYTIYKEAEKRIKESLGINPNDNDMTIKQAESLAKQLRPFIPSFNGPFGLKDSKPYLFEDDKQIVGSPVFTLVVEGTNDRATVNMKHSANSYAGISEDMQPTIVGKTVASRNINVERKDVGDPGVAASALMTHAQDAAIMALTIKKMKAAGITGLHVFDAVKTSSEHAAQVSRFLNESTIELMEMYNPLEDSMSSLLNKRFLLARLEVSLNSSDSDKVLGHFTDEELKTVNSKMLTPRSSKNSDEAVDLYGIYDMYTKYINDNNSILFSNEATVDQYPTAGGMGAIRAKITPKKLPSLQDMITSYKSMLDPDSLADTSKDTTEDTSKEDGSLFGNPNADKATLTSLVSSDTVNSVEDILTLATTVAAKDNQNVNPSYLKEMQDLLGKLYSKVSTAIDPVLVELHDGSLNTGSADTINRKIDVIRQASPVNNVTQSNTEILLHEFLHVATTASALEGVKSKELLDLWTMAKDALDYTVFLPNNTLTNTAQEIAEAKALYDYIFNNSNSINGTNVGLLEFISFGLSNPNFRDALKNIKDTNTIQTPSAILKLVKEGSFLDKIVTAVLNLIGKLLDKSVEGRKPTNVHDALISLAQHLIEVEAKSKIAASSDGFLNKVDNAVEAANKKVSTTFDKFSEKYDAWYEKQSNKPTTTSTTSTRLDPEQLKLAQWAYYNLAKSTMGYTDVEALRAASSILTYEDRTQALSTLAHATVLKDTGLLKHLYHQVFTEDPLSKPWIKALRVTKAGIEMHRKAIQETVTGSVKNGFTKLTEEQDDFLERTVLRTDLQALHAHLNYDVKATIDMLKDSSKLAKFIKDTEARLKLSPAIISQANGLAEYMITGKTSQKNQLRNSTAIALHAKSEISVPDLDAYITALAIQKASVDVTTLDGIGGLEEGLNNLLEFHRGYVQDTKETIFHGSELQMIKGYTREAIDNTKEYAFMRTSDVKELKADGWNTTELMVQDPITGTSLSMYVRSNVMKAQVHSGVFSLMSNRRKGTSYSDMLRDAGITDPKEIAKRVNNLNASRDFVPILNNNGEIIDYVINISESNRVKHLNKKYSASEALGRMYGSKLNKQLTPNHNTKMVEVAKRQWDAEKATNANKFEWIDANHKEYGDLYKSLPAQTKADIESTFGRSGIPVPKGSVPLALGFEKYLVGDSSIVKFMQAKMPKVPVKYFSNLITRTWQDFVSLTKNKIVIRMPKVVEANLISNTIYLAIQGVPLKDIYNGYRDGALELKKFLDIRAEMLTLQAKLSGMTGSAKTATQRRIEMLNNVLDKSPIRDLVKEGFFQSITEDVGANNLTDPLLSLPKMAATFISSKSALASTGIDKLSKIPYAGAVVDHLMMNPNTSMFKLLNNTVKYSDFVGRYVLHKHTIAENNKLPKDKQLSKSDIMTFIAEAFIQYDLPDPKSLDFANSIGLFMFTKYFVGIQKVIRKQVKDRSLSSALALTANYALLDLSVIQDSSMFVKDLGIMMHLNPLDIVETGVTPSGLEIYMDLFKFMTPK